MVAYRSPKPQMKVRIFQGVQIVLWCNGLAHEATDFGVWVRILIGLHNGGLLEWLYEALQKLSHRFESCTRLNR